MSAIRIIALGAVVSLCLASPARAADARDTLAAYSLTTWDAPEGFSFGDTNAIAQDPVGYLWLGTSLGLVRFDGVRFAPWRLEGVQPGTVVSALRTASDGSLWVGLTTGIARIRDGQSTLYTAGEGFRSQLVARIVEDREKTIWATGATGLWRFRNDRWEQITSAQGLSARPAWALFVDRDGVVWVGSAEGVFRRDPATDTFHRVIASPSAVRAIGSDTAGSLWATDALRTLVAVSANVDVSAWLPQAFGAASDILLDRRGNTWVASLSQGLLRLRGAGRSAQPPEQLTAREGLGGNSARALYEDREGNLWVGLAGGLARLSEKTVTTVLEGETVTALATTDDGSLWVGTTTGLVRQLAGGSRRYAARDGLPGAGILSLHADRSRTLWVGTDRGVARLVNGRFVPLALPDGILLQRTSAMTTDGEGAVWINDLEEGLFRYAGGALAPVATDVPRPSTIYADRTGRIWIGQQSGPLAMFDRGQLTYYSAADKSEIGMVRTFYEDSRGTLWIGSTSGFGRVAEGRFVREDIEDLANGVLAIVEDDQARLWIATRAGILCATMTDPVQAGANVSMLTDFVVYDASAGLPGVAVRGFPGVVRAADGSIFFSTANGAARIVPEATTERPAAQLHIETVITDGQDLTPDPGRALPPGISRIEIQYTMLTLTAAANSRFVYKLDGYDRDWVRAGGRREAVYTNLPPGPYRFRVASRGGGGPLQESAWDFTIEPQFYQTRLFAASMVGLCVLLISAGWRLRLLHVKRQFDIVLTERARIAREIHDTLLQGLYGVALQLDGISKQTDATPETTRERLEGVRRLATRYIRETASSIWLLRSPSLKERDLPSAIRETAEVLTAGTPVHLECQVTGPARPLAGELEEQILRIVHEGIMNAVKHAQATRVDVALRYQPDSLHIHVSDNGCGFDAERTAHDEGAKWGLIGMKERAKQLGAALNLCSARGSGTEIELIVPTGAA